MLKFNFTFQAGILTLLIALTAVCSTSTLAQIPTVLPNSTNFSTPRLSLGQKQLTTPQIQQIQALTSTQINHYITVIQPTLTSLRNQAAAIQTPAVVPNWTDLIAAVPTPPQGTLSSSVGSSTYNFADANGNSVTVNGTRNDIHGYIAKNLSGQPAVFGPIPILHSCPSWGCNGCPFCGLQFYVGGVDNDQDGLDDNFESAVADSFTPLYGVSSGEPDQFATFGNYIPQTTASLVGANPPFSYYRVQPLGIGTDAKGTQLFALRIDYLTLWNADNGLPGGNPGCLYSYVGIDNLVNSVSGHQLDAERSVMLLAAPAVQGHYNPDPKAYSLYNLYTAAHEGTFFDQSAYASFSSPVPAGYHIQLALSLSKHSTYIFNPDGYPITPLFFINGYNASFSALYASGIIDDAEYYLSIAIGNNVFYGCLTEQWGYQQASYANTRVNVGEPAHPINGSAFIQDDSSRALNLTDKLTNPVF